MVLVLLGLLKTDIISVMLWVIIPASPNAAVSLKKLCECQNIYYCYGI